MTLFDLSDYNVRQLDPAQGTKPLDFGGGGITGSINLNGRFIAINTYHPEHGYITLTSIPPFPNEDRYDQAKVRAYRKSLVHNEGFGLQFEQDIIKREYFLIEDAVPYIRFTLADDTIAECIISHNEVSIDVFPIHNIDYFVSAIQNWRFSSDNVQAKVIGKVWIKRAEYTQLTEGGIVPAPKAETKIWGKIENSLINESLDIWSVIKIQGTTLSHENSDGSINFSPEIMKLQNQYSLQFSYLTDSRLPENQLENQLATAKRENVFNKSLVVSRSHAYANICNFPNGCMITDHMILPLLWTRDSYYVAKSMLNWHPQGRQIMFSHLQWLFNTAWRGTYWKRGNRPLKIAWGRSYMANGMPKDNKAFQFDQQLYPFLELAEYFEYLESSGAKKSEVETELWNTALEEFISLGNKIIHSGELYSMAMVGIDETPADDELDYQFHFSTTILFWYVLMKLKPHLPSKDSNRINDALWWIERSKNSIVKSFITKHKDKKIYAYATAGGDNPYIYHDANDIPLVMMPLWGFCDKDDEIWLNTIEFAFSEDNPGFYDGVLGSVHSPAPWALGDAQELIFCKVVGDRERYQRVWERLEKVAQWDGTLPEAYNIDDFSVYSRHWFAWPNAMVAIADSISWDWETEGEYAR